MILIRINHLFDWSNQRIIAAPVSDPTIFGVKLRDVENGALDGDAGGLPGASTGWPTHSKARIDQEENVHPDAAQTSSELRGLTGHTTTSGSVRGKNTPGESIVLQKTHEVPGKSGRQPSMSIETKRESSVHHQMKSHCLLRRDEYHTTAWMDLEATKLGLLVEIPGLSGLWEIVEIYPYRLSDKQPKDILDFVGCDRNRTSFERV